VTSFGKQWRRFTEPSYRVKVLRGARVITRLQEEFRCLGVVPDPDKALGCVAVIVVEETRFGSLVEILDLNEHLGGFHVMFGSQIKLACLLVALFFLGLFRFFQEGPYRSFILIPGPRSSIHHHKKEKA